MPKQSGKKQQKHNWIFAEYFEHLEQREDNKAYRAFVFRNKSRTAFGLKEFYNEAKTDFRALAAKVVSDTEFRESLISDDEDLPKIWKRH
ncbi:MAG: hypothetical protein HC846_08910 [Blastocatellia bacterium]|nr:hypothetical protein [Blastocatellia bacterium]